MHLFYVDESGSINKEGKPFIICGLLVSPFQSKQIEILFDDKIASLRHNYPLEIHGSEIYNRRDSWRSVKMNKPERLVFMHEIYEIITKNVLDVIFHTEDKCDNEKQLIGAYGAFFEKYEKYCLANDIKFSQILMDTGKYTDVIQRLFLKRSPIVLDVPFEVDSKYSRAIQAADMVAYLKAMQVNNKIWSGKGFEEYFVNKNYDKASNYNLTKREIHILSLYKNGWNIGRIADILKISERTVLQHLHSVKKKTNTKTIEEVFDIVSKNIKANLNFQN